jgi:hypothetical protein
MKTTTLLLFAIGLSLSSLACSRTDEETARRQAREAAHQVEVDAKKASNEINHDLDKTRNKVHEVLQDTR